MIDLKSLRESKPSIIKENSASSIPQFSKNTRLIIFSSIILHAAAKAIQ